jgi:hypothetical protein
MRCVTLPERIARATVFWTTIGFADAVWKKSHTCSADDLESF